MNIRILSCIFTFFLLFSSVSAIEYIDEETTQNTADWVYIQDGLSLWDKLMLEFQSYSMTIIDGSACSEIPYYSGTLLPKAYPYATGWRNSVYDGMIVKMYKVINTEPYETELVEEMIIHFGKTVSIELEANTEYHYDKYMCTPSIVYKTCTDTDDLDYFNRGSVTISTNEIPEQSYYDSCSSSDNLYERYCDADDNLVSKAYTCPDGCEYGACVIAVPTTKEITCYPLLANCDARTFTVDLTDDCSDVMYNDQDIKSYSNHADCDYILNPPLTDECDRWVFDKCVDGLAQERCFDSDSVKYFTTRQITSSTCEIVLTDTCDDWQFIKCLSYELAEEQCYDDKSNRLGETRTVTSSDCGIVLTNDCNDWHFIGCDGDMAKEQCFDTSSKLYSDTRLIASADCVEDEPVLTDDCNNWELIGCDGAMGKEYCIDPLSEMFEQTRLVDNTACANNELPAPHNFVIRDWVENNLLLTTGLIIGLIFISTLLIISRKLKG